MGGDAAGDSANSNTAREVIAMKKREELLDVEDMDMEVRRVLEDLVWDDHQLTSGPGQQRISWFDRFEEDTSGDQNADHSPTDLESEVEPIVSPPPQPFEEELIADEVLSNCQTSRQQDILIISDKDASLRIARALLDRWEIDVRKADLEAAKEVTREGLIEGSCDEES